MIEQGEMLVLSNDKEYAVVSSIMMQDTNYLYLVDTEKYSDYKICKFVSNNLKEVVDTDLLRLLIARFNTDLKDNLAKIINE